jgi:hypothetical protein
MDEKTPPHLDDTGDEKNADRPWWSDAVKDLASAGLATLFMTEDSVRSYLREKKLPKELVSDLMDGIGRKKSDLYTLVAQEVSKVFSKIDVSRELTRFLEEHKISFEGKVSFEPKDKHPNKES